MLEQVKAGTYQVFEGDKDTRERRNFSFLIMDGLSEHEGRANLVDYTLISHFSARRGLVKKAVLSTDDPHSQHRGLQGY